MDVLYPHAKFGGDRFTHDNRRSKATEFFVCHAGHGLNLV